MHDLLMRTGSTFSHDLHGVRRRIARSPCRVLLREPCALYDPPLDICEQDTRET
jgi:hypothetical protein